MKRTILSASLLLSLAMLSPAAAKTVKNNACTPQECAPCKCLPDSCQQPSCCRVAPPEGAQICPEEAPCRPEGQCNRPPMPCGEGDVWQKGCFQPGQGSPCTPGCAVPPAKNCKDFHKRPHGKGPHGRGYHRGPGIGARLTEGLDLTPQQEAQMRRIEEEHQASFDKERKKIQEKQIKLRKEAKKKMDSQRASLHKDFMKILTPEQKKIYEENLKKCAPKCKGEGSVKITRPMPVPQPPLQYAAPSK